MSKILSFANHFSPHACVVLSALSLIANWDQPDVIAISVLCALGWLSYIDVRKSEASLIDSLEDHGTDSDRK